MTLNTAVVVPMPSAKESTARAGADGRTFLGARHWDDDGSVQRHLRFVSEPLPLDRKSTRLNSSHGYISYAVFCLKKKNNHYVSTRFICPTILDRLLVA